MSLVHLDGFDHYASADLTKKYLSTTGSGGLIDATAGRRGSGAYKCTSASTVLAPFSGRPTIYAGVAFKSPFPTTGTIEIIAFLDHTYWIGFLSLNTDGALTYYRAAANATASTSAIALGSTRSACLTANTWYYIEIRMTAHLTAGTVEVRVNGVQELLLENAVTLPTGPAATIWQAKLYAPFNGSATGYADDFYLCDDQGSVNNTFLGDVRVDPHYPNANGAHSEWTRSTGADQYATIDEVAPNGTDYNSTTTVNAIDTVGIENLKNAGGTIKGVQVVMNVSKSDAGSCKMKPVLRVGSTDYEGNEVAPSYGSFVMKRQAYDTVPGAGAWDEATFNAMEAGYKRTA